MKKSIIFTLLIASMLPTWAQNKDIIPAEAKEKFNFEDLIIKDRLFVDVFSSIWINFNNNQYKQRGINQGVNAAFMFDLPVRKNSPFSFGIGVGVTSHNLFSNAHVYIGPDYVTMMKPITDAIEYDNNKISFTNINIPLEFRYFHSSGFKISAGVRVGLMADVHTKYYGRNIDGADISEKYKNKKIPNYTKVPVEFTFRTGWKYFAVNASYMVTKLFVVDKAPQLQMYPFNVGISIALY